jgi:hypothetical protein
MIIVFIFLLVIILSLLILIANTKLNNINGGNISPKRQYRLFTTDYRGENKMVYPLKCYEPLIKTLNSLGWEEANSKDNVDFAFSLNYIFLDDNIKDNFFTVKASLKSALINMRYLNKYELAVNAQRAKKSSHFALTYALKDYKWRDDIIIVREVYTFQQAGVYIVIDEKEFNTLKKKLLSLTKNMIAVSLYIKNPLLFKGRKFHLRVLVCIFMERRGENISPSLHSKISYNKSMIEILTAKKEYVVRKKEDYLDKDMNITGGATTYDLYLWPKDFQKSENLDESFIHKCDKSINSALHSINLSRIDIPPDQNAGFHVFGADILLDDTGHAWILELNRSPAHEPPKSLSEEDKKKYILHYFPTLFKWLLDDIILPYFN